MGKIIAGKIEGYNFYSIREVLEKGFNSLEFHPFKKKVLLKPNLLKASPPENAVTTHPCIVDALSSILRDYSCEIYIGDSPGYESTAKVLKRSGYTDVIARYNIKISSFNKKIFKRINGISPYKEFIMGEDPNDYEIIINLPKLKSHTMMGLTLGVKNTFGFIHSLHKAKWHLRAGKSREIFARTLIDIHRIVNPSITILDGIIGMDGDGPSNGRPRDFDLICISKDAFILDHYIERLIGLRHRLPVTEEALKHSIIDEYEVEEYGHILIRDFIMPGTMMDTDWAIPGRIKGLLRGFFIKKPRLKKDVCQGCGLCRDICPAKAIRFNNETPFFDYKSCIRCYCCQEMCPKGAIKV